MLVVATDAVGRLAQQGANPLGGLRGALAVGRLAEHDGLLRAPLELLRESADGRVSLGRHALQDGAHGGLHALEVRVAAPG